MQLDNHLKGIIIGMTLTGLTGCELPPNISEYTEHKHTPSRPWINDDAKDEKIRQGLTAYLAMEDAFSSIASRIHLIRNAKNTLELQYYIWNNDFIGHLMFAELLRAADRGVKIKLLIDDQNGTQLDPTLKVLSLHPNFEIKIFNPYKYRHLRALDYFFRMKYVNQRMHNKLIIADGVMAVTGGRNISREYFDASQEFQFTDMDILFSGKAVEQANQVFAEFWLHELSYSSQQLLGFGTVDQLIALRKEYDLIENSRNPTEERISQSQELINQYLQERPINWAKAYFVADSPKKIKGLATGNELIYNQMISILGEPKNHLELVSAYFVPTEIGQKYLSNISKNGINVRILTNSLPANDVALVHAFYGKYRKSLLEHGVQLYEFKPYQERKRRTWYEVATGNVIPSKGKNSSSLHAKFFDVDGKVFIGSFNFDPRSVNLNTEVGLVIESEALQKQITLNLDKHLPQIAYKLKLDQKGNIVWLEQKKDGKVIEHQNEPGTSRFQRFMMDTVSRLPIEWMM